MKSLVLRFLVALPAMAMLSTASAESRRFPESPAVIVVTAAPYHAKGDGVTDDSAAIQSAVNDHTGTGRLIFFPAGRYLVTRTITWPKNWQGRENWGRTYLRGESRDTTSLVLRDGVFADETKPQAIMWCGGFGSADWFHNYVEQLTFDVGKGNPGAVALQFYSNNSGAVRDCRFIAADGSGHTGLDLGHRDMNGPLLVRNCEVRGFAYGISCAHAVNGQVFEHLRLSGQRTVALRNEGQHLSIRGLTSENAVPAVMSYGALAIDGATLTGTAGAENSPAIVNYNGGRIYLRDVKTRGYKRALSDMETPDAAAAWRIEGEDKPGTRGPDIADYSSQKAASPFPSPALSLRLAVKETPELPWDDPADWADVDRHGADPTGEKDSAAAIQKAIDSGATTAFFPGSYRIATPVVIRGKVRRLIGLGGSISYGKDEHEGRDFRLADGDSPLVVIEHFSAIHGGIEIDTRRSVLFRSVSDCDLKMTAAAEGGEIFTEDFVTHRLHLRKQRMWARQLNVENEGTHITNEAGDLWVLGYKTERGGTLLHTRGGGRSEILGGFSYTTTAGKLAPMFVNDDSAVWAWFGEVCFSGDPFTTLIRETRGGETRDIARGEGNCFPYSGRSASDR
jgi:hypothetical protein